MRKGLFLFTILLFSLSSLWSQDHRISVRETSPGPFEYGPGSVAVRPVMIKAEEETPTEISTEVLLPETWRLLNGRETFLPDHTGSHLLLVSFHIPAKAGAGEYAVTVVIRSGEEETRLDMPVVVLPKRGITCVMLEQPDYILAGEAYKVVFGCTNAGNVPVTAVAEVTSGSGFDLRAEVTKLPLLPGETIRLSVIVDTPMNLYTPVRHNLALRLYAEEDETVTARASSLVDIIPRTTGRDYRYNTILGELTTRGVLQHGDEDLFGLEGEITGQGFLDDEKETFLYFRLKKPLAGAGTLIQDRDEYLVKVTAPDYTAALGKQFFSLSPMTEASKQGTGASVSTDFGNLSLSAFAMDNLLELQNENRFGAKLSYCFGDRGVAAFNLLEAEDDERWTTGSLEGHFLLPSGNRFEWEYASSDSSIQADDAWYANLGGSSEMVSYNMRYLRSGPRYYGSLEDVEQLIASVNYSPVGPIRLRALLGRKDYHLVQEIPDSLRSLQFGLSWAGFDHTLFSADVLKTLNEDRGSNPVERLERETYRFALVHDTPSADFKLSYEFGNALNPDNLPRSFSERINARLDVTSILIGDLEASLGYCFRDYDDTKAPYSDVTLAWMRELSGRMALSARYRTVNSDRSYYLGSDNLSVTLDVTFPNQAEMAVMAEYGPHRSTGNPEDLKVTISFSTPFPIPVSVKRNIGRIEGKILESGTGKPVQDIVLRLGDAVAATDPFGQYSFHSLPVGLHRLYLDPASLPADYIAEEKMPLEVTVSDTTTEKDIRITRAAGITGRIVLFRFDRNYRWLGGDQGAAYVDPTGMPGVLLTAAGPTGIRRALSGDDGNFSFPPLVPGEWKLTVPEGALPEGHFLAKGEFDLVLEPGQKEDVVIKIFPKVRQIRFIDQGTVTEEAPVEEEPQADTEE